MRVGKISLPVVTGLCLGLLVSGADYLSAAVGERLESSYSIHALGMNVGELKTVCSTVFRNDRKALKFESFTHINTDLLLYAYRLQNREEAIVTDEGTVRYQRATTENGNRTQVEGRLENGRFLLDIRENGKQRTMAVNRESYDFTSMECPEVHLKHEGEDMTVRLLDMETLTVVSRHYRWAKSEDVEVDGRRIRCRVIDFEDKNKKCRRWIKPGEAGIVIARQDGKGKSGSYSLRIVHLKTGVCGKD